MKSNKSKDKVQYFNQEQNQNISSENSQNRDENAIPVIEERLNVSVQDVEKGKVRVSKQVHEEEVTIDIPLVHDEIDVQRVEKNIVINAIPDVRYEGDTMIIPVIKEEVVVQKKLVLIEEIHVTKKKIEEHHPQQVILKKEEVKVDRTNNTDH